MKYRRFFLIIAGFLFPSILGAAGISQPHFSDDQDYSPAGLAYVTPPQEVWLDAYIAQADYNYPPPPSGPFSVIPVTDIRDSTAYLLIGFKGKKENFRTLPPMNLSFVIDTSAFMEEDDKLAWVKDSFYAFINQVRETDIISVVVFADQAELLVPPTLIQTQDDRDQFSALIESLEPGGGANMYEGMLLGYAQVEANYQGNYLNRVILLSGGRDGSAYDKTAFLELNGGYNLQGIDISTVALGTECDINLMADMAALGGGAFRFIPDFETMEQTFGSDLDRLVVPAVWKLELELALAPGVQFRESWGYNYWIENGVMHFGLGALHNGDSKTLVTIADLKAFSGNSLGTYSLLYTDAQGRNWRVGPFDLALTRGTLQNRRALTDPRIREAEGIITLGKSLIDIGQRAAAISRAQAEYGSYQSVFYDEDYYDPAAGGANVQRARIAAELENCLSIIRSTWDYLADISNNTDGGKYAKELQILEDYEYAFNQFYDDSFSY